MLIEVKRFGFGSDSTLGSVFVDGEWVCYSLEDEVRQTKVWGETAIWPGSYDLKLRTHGGFHARYSKRFPSHRGMLEVVGVREFSDILFHAGNTDDDTAGCILVGRGAEVHSKGEFRLMGGTSVAAYLDLYSRVLPALQRRERVRLTVVNQCC